MGIFNFLNKKPQVTELAATEKALTKKGNSYVPAIAPKSISQTRKDIKNWTDALNMAQNVDQPKRFPLYNLYREIMLDLHLQSQVNNRLLKTLAQSFVIKDASGTINVELTALLNSKKWVNDVNKAIVETRFYGHSMGEFNYVNNQLTFDLIPRQNVDPLKGLLYFDYTEDKFIKYREIKEYNSWLLEFGSNDDFGLLNGVVPHVLFKKFAQSCWSELCEIYGIPPRVLKTNTQDKTLVSRGEKMLTDMGSAAWFIIDQTEAFEWAKGVDTNGDVYKNLIQLCNNEMSMGISGANVGQDTVNGSNSKETISVGLLEELIQSDLFLIEQYWNSKIIPALKLLGIITQDVTFGYPPAEDLDALWKRTTEAANFLEVDPKWVNDTFGVKVVGAKKESESAKLNLNINPDFFV